MTTLLHFCISTFLLSLLGLGILSPESVHAQKPTRRAILEQGEQILEQKKQTILNNQNAISEILYTEHVMPLLNIAFESPQRKDEKEDSWDVHIREDTTSEHSRYDNSDGSYVILEETQHEEKYQIFIYSKDYPEITTIDTAKAEWQRQQRQPDHDNVYEYSHLGFIRELNVIRTDDYTYKGKPALYIEYTFSNWSKFWHTNVIMFPYGKKVYTIKYRRERDVEDRFYEVFDHVLDTLRFLTPEPVYSSFTDLSASHPYATAIERLKDLGILQGYNDNTIKPDTLINRAEFAKILTSEPLVNATELATCNVDALTFSDVPKDAWYVPHLCVAVARGMIGGYPNGTFGGGNIIIFAEAAKIVANFFSEEEIPTDTELWYRPFISYLSNRKAIPASLANPSTPLTRGAMAQIIYNLLD